jgi:hypothetical protein
MKLLFRQKPIEIEAVQFTGKNHKECLEFCPKAYEFAASDRCLGIHTVDGVIVVPTGNWIIKGITGEFCSCDDDFFKLTYEQVKS